jgi:acyl-homoserine lactone acylase PvdQ
VRVVALLLAAGALAAGDPLARQVTICRDDYGVPHIIGDSEEATFFGYGYAQAQDHLEAMMLQYRDAQGRRAEVLGFEALAEGYLQFIPYEYRWDGDYLQRLLRTKKAVIENRAKIPPAVYAVLDGFARGVNAYIAEHRAKLPDWIEPITAEDVEALERSHYLRFYSIHDALSKLADKPYSFPNLGSNHFAIAREKSAGGRVIHVEHTHMPWANRFQNYEAHLITPGRLNAAGISWFGSPFFLMGFNEKITWSATYNSPNIADVYEEKLDPRDHRRYLYDGEWRPVREEFETFRIRGPRGIESVTLPLYYTHHGPVVKIDRRRHRAYAVKLPKFDAVDYSAFLYGLMKAASLDEFKSVLRRHGPPRWNFLYSDEKNIYWIHNALVARRPEGFDWRKPVPGWTSKTEWGPYLPLEAHPQLLNPPSGFLQNANNPPWLATRNSGLKPLEPAPYYLAAEPRADAGEEALNTRGERLFQVLGQDRKFTIEEMKALALDTYVVPAEVIVPLLRKAVAGRARNERLAQAMRRIDAWDFRSGVSSIAYTYIYFWGKAYQELYSAPLFSRFLAPSRRSIDIDAPEEQDRACGALTEALRRIEKFFGRTEVPWGEVNVAVRGETFPMDGTPLYGVLHPDQGIEGEDGRIYSNDGWGHLLVVMEGEPKQAWSLLPYGQSEDPSSPHYNDQARMHSQGLMKPFRFHPQEISEHTRSVWGDRERIVRYLKQHPQ